MKRFFVWFHDTRVAQSPIPNITKQNVPTNDDNSTNQTSAPVSVSQAPPLHMFTQTRFRFTPWSRASVPGLIVPLSVLLIMCHRSPRYTNHRTMHLMILIGKMLCVINIMLLLKITLGFLCLDPRIPISFDVFISSQVFGGWYS